MDLWEANRESFALTPHPCETSGYVVCEDDSCGGTYSEERYNGQCDPDGCDLNPFRHLNTDFYGVGKTVDTSKKFTVVTQFHGSGATLNSINQYFIQDGVRIDVPESKHAEIPGGTEINEEFCDAQKELFGDNMRYQELGGLAQMGDATGAGMVLVMSIWDDVSRPRARAAERGCRTLTFPPTPLRATRACCGSTASTTRWSATPASPVRVPRSPRWRLRMRLLTRPSRCRPWRVPRRWQQRPRQRPPEVRQRQGHLQQLQVRPHRFDLRRLRASTKTSCGRWAPAARSL